jgi:uncharacterized protein GlcG (DUF336 family)
MAAPAAAPPPRSIPLALAKEAADVALSTCAANGYKVAVAVVDAQGDPRLTEVADGAFYMAGTFAGWKAKTAALLDETTASLSAKAKTDPAVAQKIKDNGGGDSAGGQPLVAGGAVVGGLGVGGAPGGEKDDVCATAALAKIRDRLK